MKKIVITGATGSIGRILMQKLIARKDEVIIFTRNIEKAKSEIPDAVRYVKWDYKKPEEWKDQLNGVDAVVHLAGANLSAKRWNEARIYAPGFEIFRVYPIVADLGIRHGHQLEMIRRVCDNFLVAHHGGVKHHLAHAGAHSAQGKPFEVSAV